MVGLSASFCEVSDGNSAGEPTGEAQVPEFTSPGLEGFLAGG